MLRAFLCILSYILCDWIASMRNTKHELSTVNMFYSPQKIVILHAKQNARFDVRLTVPVVIKLNFVTFLG